MRMPGLTRDTRIVSARRQQKSHVSTNGKIKFVHRMPGCDMVGFGGHNKAWHANISQCQRPAIDLETAGK